MIDKIISIIPPNAVIDTGQSKNDFVGDAFGSTIPYVIRNQSGDWRSFTPTSEKQWNGTGNDTWGCTVFSGLNGVEATIKFLTGREENFSDPWGCTVTGTKPGIGNYVVAIHDVIHNLGIPLQSEWDVPANWTLVDFYRPVTQESKQQAKKFLGKYTYNYQWLTTDIPTLKKYLKMGPIVVTVATCTDWNNSANVAVCGKPNQNHAVLLTHIDENDECWIFDSYGPFSKKLTKGYRLFSALMTFLQLKSEFVTGKLPNGTYGEFATSEEAYMKMRDLLGKPYRKLPNGKLDWSSIKEGE